MVIRRELDVYVVQTRPEQLDEFGDEFFRPGSQVSHHDSNDYQRKKESKLTKQRAVLTG
jgi:hypothetical protein